MLRLKNKKTSVKICVHLRLKKEEKCIQKMEATSEVASISVNPIIIQSVYSRVFLLQKERIFNIEY